MQYISANNSIFQVKPLCGISELSPGRYTQITWNYMCGWGVGNGRCSGDMEPLRSDLHR